MYNVIINLTNKEKVVLIMTEVKFLNDGQGYFDFDALLKITSAEFIEKVEFGIEFFKNHGEKVSISVDDLGSYVNVCVAGSEGVCFYLRYDKKDGFVDSVFLSKYDVIQMIESFKKSRC